MEIQHLVHQSLLGYDGISMESLELLQKGGLLKKEGYILAEELQRDCLLWGFVKRSHCSNSEELPNSFFYLCFGVYCESILSL